MIWQAAVLRPLEIITSEERPCTPCWSSGRWSTCSDPSSRCFAEICRRAGAPARRGVIALDVATDDGRTSAPPCVFVAFLSRSSGELPMALKGLDTWYAFMKTHDAAALWDLLHPDAVFESPVVHTPQVGRDIVFKYLKGAEKVLGGPGFTYVGEWRSDNSAVLEFENVIDGIKINGVDIITFADDGRITHFKVMVRPLKAINLLHRLMGEQLAQQ
uniref:SnoaL-like domain-containing protein n=2 Tax=Rhodopseudomonas palustris (strain ATCC BAA-98 / CGA009) TaxID=258594 RepID=Q6NBL3_RHOPA|nr:conserved hypothetical protein [Rhodopseudomonas palustris CGA009]